MALHSLSMLLDINLVNYPASTRFFCSEFTLQLRFFCSEFTLQLWCACITADDYVFTHEDWSDLESTADVPVYDISKTKAELAAWDFISKVILSAPLIVPCSAEPLTDYVSLCLSLSLSLTKRMLQEHPHKFEFCSMNPGMILGPCLGHPGTSVALHLYPLALCPQLRSQTCSIQPL